MRMKSAAVALVLVSVWTGVAVRAADDTPEAPPATDIWLASLSTAAHGLELGALKRITDSTAYDNQPAFTPDSKTLFFSEQQGDGQTDIMRCPLDAGSCTPAVFVHTPESEYSPLPQSDGSVLVVRVEADSTQRIWRLGADGSSRIVRSDLKGVGYHAWTSAGRFAALLVTDPTTLVIGSRDSGADHTLAHDIGRSLGVVPGRTAAFSYIATNPDTHDAWVYAVDSDGTMPPHPLFAALTDSQDLAWTPQGMALMASGTELYGHSMDTEARWRLVVDFGEELEGKVTRIAVSLDGHWIALAVERTDTGG